MRAGLVATILLSIVDLNRVGAQWPDPYAVTTTAGGYLENEFKKVVEECGLTGVRQERQIGSPRVKSSIPALVRNSVRLNDGLLLRRGESAARVFYYVYPSQNITTGQQLDPTRYFVADMETEPVTMLAAGFNSVFHTHNCSSVLNSALQAGLNVPIADVKAAFSAEFSGTNKTVLALVEGRFFSPITLLLTSAQQVDRVAAHMLFWEWYTRNSALAGSPQFYITQFDGFAMYGMTKRRRDSNGQLTLEAGGAVPFASIAGKLKAELLTAEGTDVKAFSTGIYRRTAPIAQVSQLPSPSTVAAELSAIRPAVIVENLLVVQNRPHTHQVELTAIPAPLCSVASWSLEAANPPGRLAMSSATPLPNSRGCQFTISFTPDPAAFQNATAPVPLAYSVVSSAAPAGARVRWVVDPITLNLSGAPLVAVGAVDPRWSTRITQGPVATSRELAWRIPLVIDDNGSPLDLTQLASLRNPVLICDQATVTVDVDQQIQIPNNKRPIIEVRHAVFAGDDIDEQAPQLRECSFTASVALPLQGGGGPAIRGIPTTRLQFPGRKTSGQGQ